MKKIIVFVVFTYSFLEGNAQSFKVTLQTPNYKKGIAYLAYHMGKALNVEDSAAINNKGVAVFTGNRRLPGGIYSIVFPGKSKSFDFFVDKEQTISIVADTTNLLNKTKITGSNENLLFQQYQKFIFLKEPFIRKEKEAFVSAKTKQDSALHEKNYATINKQLNDFRENIIKKNPTSMMAAMLNAMREPKMLSTKLVTREDSLQNYYYYKAHYWDGITFMDERVIRTPFFLPKLENYYREIIPQIADSIIKESDYQILLARSCPEMYKFLINWFTDEYYNPKYMGQDAVFVNLFNKYHSKNLTPWLNEKQHDAINKRAYMLMANLIGEQAANLQMLDSAGKLTPLHDVVADYTVVVFWDPNCGHCKTEVPRIDSIYKANWKQKNVKMYGVLSADTKDDVVQAWKKYIVENKITDWVNVYQTPKMKADEEAAGQWGYHQLFDITTTPTLYLLDKEKRIIGKKLTWDQLNDLLQVKIKSQTK